MEYIEGHDLHDLVQKGGPLPIKLTLDCTIQAGADSRPHRSAG